VNPTRGETTIAAPVLPSPPQTIAPIPFFATPAPTSPPIDHFLEMFVNLDADDEGHQVCPLVQAPEGR
jgi:hypothetical protein